MPSPGLTRKQRALRGFAALLGASGILAVAAWALVNSTSWAGPLFANGLRAVVGVEAVARLEDFAYSVEDRINLWYRRGEKPRAYWKVPAKTPAPALGADAEVSPEPQFELASVGPVHKSWFAPGDGEWVPVLDPRHPQASILMKKTLLHPDENRSWAELFVIAVDLDQADLHLVPGTREPEAEAAVPESFARPGRIPTAQLKTLVGAFNGGFMAEHGHYGMRVDDITLIAPRDRSCTVASYGDGTLEIASWKELAGREGRMAWLRQTPPCMYEAGKMNPRLGSRQTRAWGATLDGDTVIRRSAIGLDGARRILFVGVSNHTTARALAEGMRHAGAVDVAQLDVNWSYPKFLIYAEGPDGQLVAQALMDGFEYSPDEYVKKSSLRDFFFLTRRERPLSSRDGANLCRNCQKSR